MNDKFLDHLGLWEEDDSLNIVFQKKSPETKVLKMLVDSAIRDAEADLHNICSDIAYKNITEHLNILTNIKHTLSK